MGGREWIPELSPHSSCKGSGDLSLTCKLAGISLADTLLYMLPDLPLMDLKIGIDRFSEEVVEGRCSATFSILRQRQHQPGFAAWAAIRVLQGERAAMCFGDLAA
jgi:hypothetical protein